jgi:hypothetical protein
MTDFFSLSRAASSMLLAKGACNNEEGGIKSSEPVIRHKQYI